MGFVQNRPIQFPNEHFLEIWFVLGENKGSLKDIFAYLLLWPFSRIAQL